MIDPSNFLGATFANPYYPGRAGAAIGEGQGGFGTPLYNTTGGPAGRTGFGATGTAGLGGTTGLGATGRGSTLGTGATATGFGRATTGIGGARGTTGFGGAATGGQLGRTTTGTGGLGSGAGTGGFTGGVIVPLAQPIAYRAVLKFKAPPPPSPTVLQADLKQMIVGSSFVPSAANVQITTAGSAVLLRGTVADADEARTIEGMVRLTPGVTAVRNELVVR